MFCRPYLRSAWPGHQSPAQSQMVAGGPSWEPGVGGCTHRQEHGLPSSFYPEKIILRSSWMGPPFLLGTPGKNSPQPPGPVGLAKQSP